MKVLILGATGMLGAGTLLECLDDPGVDSILVVGRHACGIEHAKIRERLVPDLFDIATLRDDLRGLDACFFCLGVSSVGLSASAYRRVTYDLTMTIARSLRESSPEAVFVYVSGRGTDGSLRSRGGWARTKGETENALLAMGFRAAYMFRPAFIQPMRGIRSRTWWYQAVYDLCRPIAPLLLRAVPSLVTTSVTVGRAMIAVARQGYPKPILEVRDINRVGGGTLS